MHPKPRIAVVIGSTRPSRFADAPAQWILRVGGSRVDFAGQQLLQDIDAMAHRVKRVATGWEAEFTVAVDTALSPSTVMELAEAFYALQPTTRLRLRDESLSGTLEALTAGQADLALGVALEASNAGGVQSRLLGEMPFVYAVAPHHPLAALPEPLPDDLLQRHRAIAVADSVQRGQAITRGLLAGQDVGSAANCRNASPTAPGRRMITFSRSTADSRRTCSFKSRTGRWTSRRASPSPPCSPRCPPRAACRRRTDRTRTAGSAIRTCTRCCRAGSAAAGR